MQSNLQKRISEKRDEINRHYWRFTRQAKGNPPPAHLYKELRELEDELKKENKPALRKHQAHWKDNTITARSDKRKAQLQAAAELNGFETWSGMMTYIKNMALQGKATVSKDNA